MFIEQCLAVFIAGLALGSCLEYRKTVCQNDSATISCPTQMSLNILQANYGRNDGSTCPNDSIQTTQCSSPTSLQRTREHCEGKNSCDLQATNGVYGDPCVDTYKYLYVRYQCQPAVYAPTVCEGKSKTISCPGTFVISIDEASYGRSNNHTCPRSSLQTTQCSAENSLETTRQRCENKASCALEANNGVYGDPCVGTYKYLRVKYHCKHPVYRLDICHGNTKTISCTSGYHLDIQWANYGRTDSDTCPSKAIYTTQCHAPSSHHYVREFCNNRRSCRLEALHTVFGDPCLGTFKYLHVTYTCKPAEKRVKVLCDESSGTISCWNGTQIRIHSAYYGRTDTSTCSTGPVYTTSCMNAHASDWVSSKCDHKTSCSVSASSSLFGDPCRKTFKYLSVQYDCVQSIP